MHDVIRLRPVQQLRLLMHRAQNKVQAFHEPAEGCFLANHVRHLVEVVLPSHSRAGRQLQLNVVVAVGDRDVFRDVALLQDVRPVIRHRYLQQVVVHSLRRYAHLVQKLNSLLSR